MAVILPIVGVDWRTLSVDGTGTPISGTNPLPVSTTGGSGTVSTANSTTTPLAGGATFTGTAEDVSNYAAVVVTVLSDQASAANQWKLEFSPDGTNWDVIEAYDYPAALLGVGTATPTAPKGKFFRVVYVNGATPQTTFRLQTVYHTQPVIQPLFVFNSPTGNYPAIRTAASLPQGFGGGTQPAYVVAVRNSASTHDVALTAKAANTNADGVGVPAAGLLGTSDAGTTWKALLLNVDGSLPVVGFTADVDVTLTRAANATPYSAGDEMVDTGGLILTLTGMARASGGTGTIYNLSLICSSNAATKPSLEVWLFDTTSTPQTDNTAFAPADGVVATVIHGGIIPLTTSFVGDATSNTGNFVMTSGPLNIPYKCVGSANLFARIVVRAAYTPGTVSDTYLLRFGVVRD